MPDKRMKTYVVGFPRIGERRELKKVLEKFWSRKITFDSVIKITRILRKKHWFYQKEAGIDFISSNDFSLYDSMLDTAIMLGAIPERFERIRDGHERYFAMARGAQGTEAMEMTKWFNTNYHYIVPELSKDMGFSLNPKKLINEYREARELRIKTKINVIGPITFLTLSKRVDGDDDTLSLLPQILPHYVSLLNQLARLDDEIVIQFDEPSLVRDPDPRTLDLFRSSYEALNRVDSNLKLVVMTYFDHAKEAVKALKGIPVYGVGLDFVHGRENLDALTDTEGKKVIAGLVDGRNVWRNDYEKTLALLGTIENHVDSQDIILSTSCSLLHTPYSLEHEEMMEQEIRSWMSFSREKLRELTDISTIFYEGGFGVASNGAFEQNRKIIQERYSSSRVLNKAVRRRVRSIGSKKREGTFPARNEVQKQLFALPLLPTTTIGSFPQTEEIRRLRQDYKNGTISDKEYGEGIRRYIDLCLEFQQTIGLDVLVHGEPERNDMVEYFAEKLSGFLLTQNGWVQSYGSRCVKPPVIYGDTARPKPMTVDIISYAQSKTTRFVKGILTGPVTILNWSFVRDDLERASVCEQIAVAIRDEIEDLQNAGIRMIQVDEAAFKEGYPLRKSRALEYEKWAVRCFQLAVSTAAPETQIHTHMCYSDFNDIIHTIEKMDADVIAIETARSGNRLLKVFVERGYKNEIGPGIYDIHSPRVPSVKELEEKIRQRIKALPPVSRLWINPDCGLKTRDWDEVKQSLKNMAAAAKKIRRELGPEGEKPI
ncbi:5-methyltetrahydropteroyltriglutamate--homocysteine S-methyltransferase [Syntrophorhabdus aromaticivorans]|nr:5-methyltetrahydropteroyltriglutamate--homocysteine S-methyltransferase [Syntrophorhabdus aromaticivorans]